jgi:hypothetical protein
MSVEVHICLSVTGLIFRDGIPLMAWSVILSVYGADPIAEVKVIDLSLSALIS